MAVSEACYKIVILISLASRVLHQHTPSTRSSTQKRYFHRVWDSVLSVAFWNNHHSKSCVYTTHHLELDIEYRHPRKINYHLIAAVCKHIKNQTSIGLYSVGSLDYIRQVGDIVVLDDYFNPFQILHLSDT